MTPLEYDGLKAMYYQFHELSAKYDSLKLKAALKDTALTMCMQSRDSLIMDNKVLINEMSEISIKLEEIREDISKERDNAIRWKTIGISTSVGLVITSLILIIG
jgi:hypothetical protein